MVRVMAAVGMMEDGVCFAGLAMTVSSGLALTRPIVTARPQAEAVSGDGSPRRFSR